MLLKELVSPPRLQDQEVTKIIVQRLKETASLHGISIILYGSRVRGHARRKSDIDLMIDENPERARDKQDIIEKILSDLGLKISIVTPSKVGYEFSEIIRNTGWKITPQTSDFPMSPIQDFAMGNIPDWVSLPIRYAHWNLRYAEYYCHHDKDRAVRHFAKACLRILHLIEESNLTIQSIQDAYAIIDHASVVGILFPRQHCEP
jgi:predicted nucleotidyltransferase